MQEETRMLEFKNHFVGEKDPFDEINWEIRTACVKDGSKILFKQEVEVPSFWSQNATDIVAQHYLKIVNGVKENSIKQAVSRISKSFAKAGVKHKYFSKETSVIFERELRFLLVNQYFCFNSPVWYNLGIEEKGQLSACFIQSVEDSLESISDLQTSEIKLFSGGSGTGTNFSTLRESTATLSKGGTSSGPISFIKGLDASAGVIKSGGKTRRAAKMVIMNVDHPDIIPFIESKMIAERMAKDLIKCGWPADYNGIVYSSLPYQNANHSTRSTNSFMEKVEANEEYEIKLRSGNVKHLNAKDVFDKIVEAAYECADPGMQFDTTINEWHTCKNSGRINSSNPCSEYMFLDDTACNLASHNLVKYDKDGEFDIESFQYATELGITAMEIAVEISSYPTKKIVENSRKFRPLGIGWANGGSLLMRRGIPYDSESGRHLLASITSLMTAAAYRQSSIIARDCGGPFEAYEENKKPFIEVMEKHAGANFSLGLSSSVHPSIYSYISDKAGELWKDVIKFGKLYGFRNAQASVLAPTGTIGFMMDCDTTGIEPDIALIKYKKLVGGGYMKIINQSISPALKKLNYTDEEIELILAHILQYETIIGAPNFKKEHLPVFDCAVGVRCISFNGHLEMMAACQPFLSGAISKTINLPSTATKSDVEEIYIRAYKLGLKAVALYRDGCKASQPLNIKEQEYGHQCGFCDGKTIRTGSCHTCISCGTTTSCG